MLTLGLAKEGLHKRRQLLDAVQRTDRQSLHFVFGLNEAFGDAALHVRPNLLVRIQVRRARRQKAQLQSFLRFHEILDQRGLVNRMAVDDEEHWRAALRRPCRSRLVIRANARLIGKVDARSNGSCLGTNRRVGFELSLPNERRVLLPRLIQGLLHREAQQLHDATHSGKRQLFAELPFNQHGTRIDTTLRII